MSMSAVTAASARALVGRDNATVSAKTIASVTTMTAPVGRSNSDEATSPMHIAHDADRVADRKPHAFGKAPRRQRRHDQAREHEIDADELHRLRHHQREQHIEADLPEPRRESANQTTSATA